MSKGDTYCGIVAGGPGVGREVVAVVGVSSTGLSYRATSLDVNEIRGER